MFLWWLMNALAWHFCRRQHVLYWGIRVYNLIALKWALSEEACSLGWTQHSRALSGQWQISLHNVSDVNTVHQWRMFHFCSNLWSRADTFFSYSFNMRKWCFIHMVPLLKIASQLFLFCLLTFKNEVFVRERHLRINQWLNPWEHLFVLDRCSNPHRKWVSLLLCGGRNAVIETMCYGDRHSNLFVSGWTSALYLLLM